MTQTWVSSFHRAGSINTPLALVTLSPLTAAVQGILYNFGFVATGGTPPYSWSVLNQTGTNPPANFFNNTLVFTPTATETDVLLIQVQDNIGTKVQGVFQLPVNAPPAAAVPTFSPAAGSYPAAQFITLTDATPGSTMYYTTDGSVPTFPVTGATQLYTTPFSVGVTTIVRAIGTASGFSNSAVATGVYTISAPLVITSTSPLPPGTQSAAYTPFQLQASGGTSPYVWAIVGGTLAAGMSLSSAGILSGTPATAETDTLTIRCTDQNGAGTQVTKVFSLIFGAASTLTGFKFHPGDYFLGLNSNGTSNGSNAADMNLNQTGVVGYIARYGWPQLEPVQGQYAAAAATITTDYNNWQTKFPGRRFGIGILSDINLPGSLHVQDYATHQWSNQMAPNWILNAPGGVINVFNTPSFPNSSGPTTQFTMAAQANGQYGYGFSSYLNVNNNDPTLSSYIGGVTAIWDPGVLKAWQNFWIALSQITLVWSVASGGDGNSYTLDNHPLIELTLNGNETSYNFNQGPFQPLNTTPANLCSTTNYWNNFKAWLVSTRAAWPHTETGINITFLVTGSDGSTDTLTSYNTVNGYLSPSFLGNITGWALCGSDTYGAMWANVFNNAIGAQAQNSVQAFIGIQNPTGEVNSAPVENPPLNPSLQGIIDIWASVQTPDYNKRMQNTAAHPASFFLNTAGGVNEIIVAANGTQPATTGLGSQYTMGASRRLWNPQSTFDVSYTAWTNYIQPTFSTGLPCNQVLPTSLRLLTLAANGGLPASPAVATIPYELIINCLNGVGALSWSKISGPAWGTIVSLTATSALFSGTPPAATSGDTFVLGVSDSLRSTGSITITV